MKVICINNKPLHHAHNDLNNLHEGAVYEVVEETKGIKFDGYILRFVPCTNPLGYRRDRFIPLSEIDELELVNEKQLVNQ